MNITIRHTLDITYIKNTSGPNIEPRGTPRLSGSCSEHPIALKTVCTLPLNYDPLLLTIKVKEFQKFFYIGVRG